MPKEKKTVNLCLSPDWGEVCYVFVSLSPFLPRALCSLHSLRFSPFSLFQKGLGFFISCPQLCGLVVSLMGEMFGLPVLSFHNQALLPSSIITNTFCSVLRKPDMRGLSILALCKRCYHNAWCRLCG